MHMLMATPLSSTEWQDVRHPQPLTVFPASLAPLLQTQQLHQLRQAAQPL